MNWLSACSSVGATAVAFGLLQYVAEWLLKLKTAARFDAYKRWRIANEFVSLVHALFSASWILVVLVTFRQMLLDSMFYYHPLPAYLLLSTAGYLVYDSVALASHEWSRRVVELLFHHGVVLLGLAASLISHMYLGLVCYTLLMEISSVTLHVRSLMNHWKVSRQSNRYRVVSLLNLFTFVVFRLIWTFGLLAWLAVHFSMMDWLFRCLVLLTLASITATNLTLFNRLLRSDGYVKQNVHFVERVQLVPPQHSSCVAERIQ